MHICVPHAAGKCPTTYRQSDKSIMLERQTCVRGTKELTRAEPTQEERERAEALLTTSVPEVFSAAELREHRAPSRGRRSPGRDIRSRSCTRAWLTCGKNIKSVPCCSALEAFLVGRFSRHRREPRCRDALPLQPRSTQRRIRAALTHQISIIDGLPAPEKHRRSST